jgi:hypothetical protein
MTTAILRAGVTMPGAVPAAVFTVAMAVMCSVLVLWMIAAPQPDHSLPRGIKNQRKAAVVVPVGEGLLLLGLAFRHVPLRLSIYVTSVGAVPVTS